MCGMTGKLHTCGCKAKKIPPCMFLGDILPLLKHFEINAFTDYIGYLDALERLVILSLIWL